MASLQSNGDVIVCPTGPDRGIWCRTQKAFDTIAAVALLTPQTKRLSAMPAPGTYDGTVVSVASPEKWRELEALIAQAEQGGSHGA